MPITPLSLEESKKKEKEEEVGFFESALAGVVTGLWNIPKGFVSLGAEIFDLVGDTNTAKGVEQWFDDVNPFDDEAEARTVGKITQALTQIGIPAVQGYKIGASLASRALQAKKASKYMSMSKIGSKIMTPTAGGVVGGGIGEALVADEDIGTFADMARGTSLEPFAVTMMDKSEDKEGREEAFRRLKNRIKFGTEGALFNLGIIGAGKGIKALRGSGDKVLDEYSSNSIKRNFETFGEFGFSPAGTGPRSTFETKEYFEGMKKAANRAAAEEVKNLDNSLKSLGDNFYEEYLNARKTSKETRTGKEIFMEDLQEIISPTSKNSQRLLDPKAKTRAINELNALKEFKPLEEQLVNLGREMDIKGMSDDVVNQRLLEIQEKIELVKSKYKVPNLEELAARVRDQGAFTAKDYMESDFLKDILERVKKVGGDSNKLKDSIINARLSIDNMSSKLYLQNLDGETAKGIADNFGRYTNKLYLKYETKGLAGFGNYKPIEEVIERSKEKYVQFRIEELQRAGRPIDTDTILKEADDEVRRFAEKVANDEVTPYDLGNANVSKTDLKNVKIDNDILKQQKLNAWQQELFGVIKDPSYTFFATVGKQANLNFTLDYLDRVAKLGSGPNGFVSSVDELEDQILKTRFGKSREAAIAEREQLISLGKKGEAQLATLNEQIAKANNEAMAELSNPNKWKKYVNSTNVPTPLDGKYLKAPTYDQVFDVTSDWLNKSSVGTFYKYAVLTPKAGSQIAKTILSQLTHVRNLLSAGAFVAANGAAFPNYGDIKQLLPASLGGEGVIKQAYNLTGKRIFGTLNKEEVELTQRLLKVGVVDSAVQPGETKRLIGDILTDPAAVERGLYDRLPKEVASKSKRGLLKTFAKLQDAYVAEDDFWKIINWSLEWNRYSGIAKNLGLNQDNILKVLDSDEAAIKELGENGARIADYFRKRAPRIDYIKSGKSNEEVYRNFLDEVAGNLTRNQVPNYAYIGRTGRALRQTPFGNFIAFPLEIMRTGHNIFQQSIDEITSGIPELVGLGYKRLFSFGATVGGVPYGLVEMFKAKNDVTDQEMDALRKFVPEWSENSTLIPTGRDENGNLKYIDFSYANAYDTLIRPFNAIVNQLGEGDLNRESLMDSLGQGMIESSAELLKPYATESIFTEALIDSTFRRGYGRGGRRIWSEEDETMVKIGKGMLHVGKSLTPGSISQMKRLGQAATGTADKYGNLYNLSDELPGLWGGREIVADPARALTYMTTRFGSDLKKDNALFIAPLLRGGRVSSEDILDRYKYAESRKFNTMKEMYANIKAARTLGVPEYKIRNTVSRRGINKDTLDNLFQGVFTPSRPNKFFINRISEINRDLNSKEGVDLPNPYFQALPEINDLINGNRRISLDDGNVSFYRQISEEPQALTPLQPVELPPANAFAAGVTPQLNNPPIINQQAAVQDRGRDLFDNSITFGTTRS